MDKENEKAKSIMEVKIALSLIEQLKNDELITQLEFRKAEAEAEKMIKNL